MSELSACSYCRQVFPTERIEAWLDGGQTPVCPLCGVDCVHPGDATPLELLERFRCSFGHRPDPDDPPELRALQALSEKLTAGEEVDDAERLEGVRCRAVLEQQLSELDGDSMAYGRLWMVVCGVDSELKHHAERFQGLALAALREAWRASGAAVEHMPYWCRPERTSGP